MTPPTTESDLDAFDRVERELAEARLVVARIMDQVHDLEKRSRELPARPGQPRPIISAWYRGNDRALPRQLRWGLLCWNREKSASYWKALPNGATAPSSGLLTSLKIEVTPAQIDLLEITRRDLNRRLRLVRASLDGARKHLHTIRGRERVPFLRSRQARRVRNAAALTPQEIEFALRSSMRHVGNAADFLGVSRRTLNRYMRRHGIRSTP